MDNESLVESSLETTPVMELQKSKILDEVKYYLSQTRWLSSLVLIYVHIGALFGVYLCITSAKWQTIVTLYILALLSNIGTITSAHRYGTHKSFKANFPLRVILMILQTLTAQKTMIEWARDHHTHHQFEGTDADVVNINRGFFFAHMGWLIMRRHPDCEEKRRKIDVQYLWSDPIMRFQYNHYKVLVTLFSIVIPTLIPHYLFGETLVNSYHLCFLIRYAYTLQLSFCGNSVAHLDLGPKPYDKSMTSCHNHLFIYATLGGAYHNYHHVYPWDYSESEFGWDVNCNLNTAFIDFCHYIGWASDLKRAPKEIIAERKELTGGSLEHTWLSSGNPYKNPVLDWIYGFLLNSIYIWILLSLKML